jgi:hypothetical protein
VCGGGGTGKKGTVGASRKTRRLEERAFEDGGETAPNIHTGSETYMGRGRVGTREGRTDDRKEQLTSAISLQFLDLFVLLPYSLSDVKRTKVFRTNRNTGFFDHIHSIYT